MTDTDEDDLLQRAAERFGTPCFVYFAGRIEDRIDHLREAFGKGVEISFAVKANPNPTLLEWLSDGIDQLDISSVGELRLAQEAGWSPARLSFTGPGKREIEIQEAVRAEIGHLVLESLREARLASRIARQAARLQPVLLRISPETLPRGFGDQMAGRPTPFGIDVEDAAEAISEILSLPGLRFAGFHIYAGTQCLKAEAIVATYRHLLAIFEHLCSAHDLAPDVLVMGSGLGVPYHEGDAALDLPAIAAPFLDELEVLKHDPRFAHTRMVLELGRYLVSEAGYLVTRVVSTKLSRGKRIAICDGGMNNHLPASGHFGMVVRRNYRMHKVGTERAAEASEPEPVDIVGPLCTSIDRLASGIILPPIDEGDLIAVHHSGAYGLTASPVHFISHAMPEEIMVVEDTLLRATRCFGADAVLHRHSPCSEESMRFVEGAHPAAANQNT